MAALAGASSGPTASEPLTTSPGRPGGASASRNACPTNSGAPLTAPAEWTAEDEARRAREARAVRDKEVEAGRLLRQAANAAARVERLRLAGGRYSGRGSARGAKQESRRSYHQHAQRRAREELESAVAEAAALQQRAAAAQQDARWARRHTEARWAAEARPAAAAAAAVGRRTAGTSGNDSTDASSWNGSSRGSEDRAGVSCAADHSAHPAAASVSSASASGAAEPAAPGSAGPRASLKPAPTPAPSPAPASAPTPAAVTGPHELQRKPTRGRRAWPSASTPLFVHSELLVFGTGRGAGLSDAFRNDPNQLVADLCDASGASAEDFADVEVEVFWYGDKSAADQGRSGGSGRGGGGAHGGDEVHQGIGEGTGRGSRPARCGAKLRGVGPELAELLQRADVVLRRRGMWVRSSLTRRGQGVREEREAVFRRLAAGRAPRWWRGVEVEYTGRDGLFHL
ncbi:hypothetical protein HYH03_011505 [Edaphochlamys debaryana]|uniref:Uncharacterized protein n=1 Tax=Edaphochlamys debaryana TaxID=47281 RepID=A0A835Y008_9CHLO|nr:hypothetical protein HYH03_011505 [Edaphochlamys debaryana]|eukprot:KAG2490040.1 hypothetical protein HYH03_011505 [Edaphochlamys debaryana]